MHVHLVSFARTAASTRAAPRDTFHPLKPGPTLYERFLNIHIINTQGLIIKANYL